MRTTIAIVGAGLAGLHAARLLHAAGVDFRLLEARERPGGRILSVDGTGQPAEDGFDLGPSWFWPGMQPALARLVDELGLATFAQSSEGDVIFHRMSREAPQRYRGLGREQQSMRLAGGTGTLVRALARGLPEGSVALGARVTRMALRRDGVVLTIRRADGTSRELAAGQVVAALPPRLLEASVALDPPMDPETVRRWRETETWMAPHAKLLALYDRPFWREAGLSGTAQSMVGPLVEIHDATSASGAAALFGFLGVGADARARLGEAALARACLDQLALLFGEEARHPRATLLKDWAADPLTATPADRAAGGHPLPAPGSWVSGVWQDRLSLAGSETSASEPGYLAGAVDAAGRAVAQTLARLRKGSTGPG